VRRGLVRRSTALSLVFMFMACALCLELGRVT
jgi:hypothetical protein